MLAYLDLPAPAYRGREEIDRINENISAFAECLLVKGQDNITPGLACVKLYLLAHGIDGRLYIYGDAKFLLKGMHGLPLLTYESGYYIIPKPDSNPVIRNKIYFRPWIKFSYLFFYLFTRQFLQGRLPLL